MNKTFIFIVAGIIALLLAAGALVYIRGTTNTSDNKDASAQVEIDPIEHATAVISWADSVFYTDPVGGAEAFNGKTQADVILVTDIHGDHLDIPTLQAVAMNSVIIAPRAVYAKLPIELASRTHIMENGEKITQGEFTIEAIPMYNVPESSESRHVRGRGNGYVVERNGYRVYIAGDTAGTPEMRALLDIDVALVPMNLPFTMSVEDAADAVLAFKPAKVIPYHYRGQEGLSDIQQFKTLVNTGNPDIDVALLDWYPGQ